MKQLFKNIKHEPFVTFVICSKDKNKLANCLRALKTQNYPKNKLEFLIMTGFMPEGEGSGKQVGCRIAKGEFIAIVDEDNIVQGPEWLNQMLQPMLEEKTIIGSHCRLLIDHKDSLINQYVALVGTDPLFAYRSVDGLHFRNNKFIDWFEIDMNKSNMLVTGGNCFIYRKSALDAIGGYTQDTDNVASFVEKVICRIAVPNNARTHHLAATSISSFLTKKCYWSKQPISKKWKWIEPRLFIEVFINLTIIANIFKAIHHYYRDGKEPAWSLHPILAFLTTVIYGWNFIKSKCKSKCKSKDI